MTGIIGTRKNLLTIPNGGTGQNNKTDAFNALSPTTRKGDIIVHNGRDNVREPIGSDDQILTADSTKRSGLEWRTPVTGVDFISAFDTTTQSISVANTFQDLTFSDNGPLSGWTHVVTSADFVCPTTGKYLVMVNMSVEKTGGGNRKFGVRALFNGTEISGTAYGIDINSNNTIFILSRSFSFDGIATQILKIQIAGNSTQPRVTTGPNPGSATTNTSASITISRLS